MFKTIARSTRRNVRKGVTLIELAMVMTVAIVMVAGAMLYYQNANTSSKLNATIQQISLLQSAVASVFSNSADYTGLTNTVIIDSGQLPTKMVGGVGDINHPFNNDITLTPQGNYYEMLFTDVPEDVCRRISTIDFGRNMREITVGTGAASPDALTPAAANADCATGVGGEVDITWEFY